MKLFQSARALLTTLLMVILVAGLAACGGTGGESDTDAPLLELNPVPVSTLERTRTLSGKVEAGAQVEVSSDKDPSDKAAKDKQAAVVGENWSYSLNLVPGVNTISVKATDATGNNKTLVFPLTYEVVTLDQVLPTTALADQTLRGTLATGASLTATIAPDPLDPVTPVTPVALTPVISGNTWSLDLSGLAGTYTLTLKGSLTPEPGASPLEQTIEATLVVESSRPLLRVNPATPVGKTVSLSGTATDTATVSIVVGQAEVTVGTITQPAGSGAWSCDLSELQPGRNIITITATTTATDGSTATATAQLAVLYQP